MSRNRTNSGRRKKATPPGEGTHGGYRPGSGRKPLPRHERACVPHRERTKFAARFPVLATVRLHADRPPWRNRHTFKVIRECFVRACNRLGFRLIHYSLQPNQLLLLCEATDRKALSRGMQGLLIRVAKALNRLWQRKGTVWAERYDEFILRTPEEVRGALVYILNHHLRSRARGNRAAELDDFASGSWFDGWRNKAQPALADDIDPPVAKPHTSLIKTGWRKQGLLRVDEAPRDIEDWYGTHYLD